ARLKIDLDAVCALKRFERLAIRWRQLLHDPKHERAHLITNRHLDLWHMRTDAQAAQQLRKRLDEPSDRLGERMTLAQIRHEGARAFPETHNGLVLGPHPARPQARAAPVIPD